MRLSNRCYAVTGLGYSSPWCVNAGFVTGDKVTLIVDTGANTLAGQTIFGYARAAAPENQLLVINTEKHFDHIGGNSFFREKGIDIWGHREIARTAEEFQAEIAEFNRAIPDPVRRRHDEARAFFWATELANPNRAIERDTRLDLGGCTAEVLLTPGHTPTNLSVWVPGDEVLFTGDCLIREYLPNLDAGGPPDWHTWLQSLERLKSLHPRTVVAGHGPVARAIEVEAMIRTVGKVLEDSIQRRSSPTAGERL